MPPAISMSTDNPASVARSELVQVVVPRDLARLLARLQQLRKDGVRVLVDLSDMTVQVCGKAERIG